MQPDARLCTTCSDLEYTSRTPSYAVQAFIELVFGSRFRHVSPTLPQPSAVEPDRAAFTARRDLQPAQARHGVIQDPSEIACA